MQVQRLSLETANQVGEHVDTWFVQLRQKQGRGHPWRRRVWTSPLVRRSAKSFMQGSSSGSLRSFRPVIWFLFPHPTYPGTLPWVCMHPSAKMDLKVKVWEEQDSLCLSLSLDLRPPRSLSVRVQCLPCPKREGSRDPLILYSNRILPLSILAMTLTLTIAMITREKHWLFTLVLLLLPIWRANKRLIINALPGAHLTLDSRNARGCKYLP